MFGLPIGIVAIYIFFLIALALIPPLYLLRREKMLNEKQKRIESLHDDFTAKLVHELRAPLTVIRGTTDMFLSEPALCSSSQGKELLTTMKHSSQDMLSMVNDLLDVYKIEAGKFQVLKTRNNLSEIIHDRVIFFSQLAKDKGVNLSAQIDDNNLVADFDRERISQVLNNLLSNAIKFTPAAGRIVVTAEKINQISEIHWRFGLSDHLALTTSPVLLVAIADTGGGIATDQMGDLFSKFKQLHAPDGQGGSGLGLAIAKGIIESHAGQIFLESKPKEGTSVYFTLPITTTPYPS